MAILSYSTFETTFASRTTVSGKPGVDIPPGTLKSILKQAELEL
jgi:predicted RNA binding protein YcfA (HicA-like mRNA interferase family)